MTTKRRPAWLLALACAPVLALQAQTSGAAEYLTATAGGGGGTPFTLRCPNDMVLAGLKGKAGGVVDRVEIQCVQVDPLGRWVGSPEPGGSAGGTGGTSFSFVCGRDHAVSGIQGKAGSVIDQLRVRCGPLTAGPRLASIGSHLSGHAGGSGGNVFGSNDCADGKPGRGLSGRAGSLIDQIRLACDVPSNPLRPVSAGIGIGGTKVAPIVRGGASFGVRVAPAPRGTYRIPVRSLNPAIATFHRGSEMDDSREDGLTELNVHAPGCVTLEAGFPGDPPRQAELLAAMSSGNALKLDLSRLEWTTSTTSVVGTLTLPNPAPAGGIPVSVTSSHPNNVLVPAGVTIPAGSRTTTFEIGRSGFAAACVVLTVSGNGVDIKSPIIFRALAPKNEPRKKRTPSF